MNVKEVIQNGLRRVVGTMETFSKGQVTVIRDRKTKKILKVIDNDGHIKGSVRPLLGGNGGRSGGASLRMWGKTHKLS